MGWMTEAFSTLYEYVVSVGITRPREEGPDELLELGAASRLYSHYRCITPACASVEAGQSGTTLSQIGDALGVDFTHPLVLDFQ